MPDPRRLYRRLTVSALPTRVVAHISVVGLVVLASAAGAARAHGPAADAPAHAGFLPIVSQVRGAAEASRPPTSATFSLRAQPADQGVVPLNRAAPAQVTPASAAPLPTPVAVDPAATPLPAPAVGRTGASARGPAVAVPVPAAGGLAWPVPGGSITQYFHAGHLAVDIAAPYGSGIVSAQSGVVTWAGWRNNGGGYVIAVDHGNGIQTAYNHLGSIWVSPGQYVVAGQGIGGVGCTGMCTGPHVHFEVVVNGVIDNPMRFY